MAQQAQGDDLGVIRAAQEDHLNNVGLSPKEQQEKVWDILLKQNGSATTTAVAADQQAEPTTRTWPSYDDVLGHLSEADYTDTLTCPYDTLASCPIKTLCPHGTVCMATMEIFAGSPYSGLLQPSTTPAPCILRLSTAMKPPSLGVNSKIGKTLLLAVGDKIRKAKLFPCAAVKVFRNNEKSGNLLFGGSKVGQRESDYFAHCMCTSMTEQMPRPVKPFVKKFWRYSDYPLSLGVSDFCKPSSIGQQENLFPFAVILRPCINTNAAAEDEAEDSFDTFLDRTLSIEAGTVLFDVFACPNPTDVPDAAKLQRIGRITTTSEMVQSSESDGLFFRHQKKEEDYALRPAWPEALKAQVTINQGKTTGTIGKLAGWKLFEQHIAEGTYIDFEQHGFLDSQQEHDP